MKYRIDLVKNIVHCEFFGDLTAEDMIEHIKSMRNDPDFHCGLHTIADLTKATISHSFLEIHALAEYVKNISSEHGHFRIAWLTTAEKDAAAKLYKTLTSYLHVKECYSFEEAEDWVLNGLSS